jgi:hypothetical protein
MLDLLEKASQSDANAASLLSRVQGLATHSVQSIVYPLRGFNSKEYETTAVQCRPETAPVERLLVEQLNWLRIRADYRVDFEASVRAQQISDALFAAAIFTGASSLIVRGEAPYGPTICHSGTDYDRSIVRGLILGPDFSRTRLTQALLNSEEVTWTLQDFVIDGAFRGFVHKERVLNHRPKLNERAKLALNLTGWGSLEPDIRTEFSEQPVSAPCELSISKSGEFHYRGPLGAPISQEAMLSNFLACVRSQNAKAIVVLQGATDALKIFGAESEPIDYDLDLAF